MPEISIIVPVYNTARYLPRCIKSIQAQTFGSFELLLIDDGSADESLSVCRSFAQSDSRIRVMESEHKGVSAARNLGLRSAKGRYIMFCDSDDFTAPEWAECLYRAIQLHPNSLVGCEYADHVASTGYNRVNELPKTTKNAEIDKRHFYLLSVYGAVLHLWTKIFDSRVIKENGLSFHTDMRQGEDVVFIAEYMKYCSSFYYVKKCLYFWTDNGADTLSRSYCPHCFEDVRSIFLARKPLIDEIYLRDFYKDAYKRFMGCISVANDSLSTDSDEEKERYCQAIISDPAFIEAAGYVRGEESAE